MMNLVGYLDAKNIGELWNKEFQHEPFHLIVNIYNHVKLTMLVRLSLLLLLQCNLKGMGLLIW